MSSAANKKTSHKHNDVAAKAKAAPAVGADDGAGPAMGAGCSTAFTARQRRQLRVPASHSGGGAKRADNW